MHIRQITIHGFKSYRELTRLDKPFSPNHNVIVGRNGSGKSNFFWAVRFVLNDAYTSLSTEERQALFHDGAGANKAFSAFVEIIFDNSDGRFPTGKPETVLRRTIGSKKDEYALDKKSATKTEVMNLLESAGFSASNPYYIVAQGRITALCGYRDAERLTLLKEIAGTGVYEARRAESVKIIQETECKRADIDDMMANIDRRLGELEGEKKTLTEFTELDNDRRCLDYALHDREFEQTKAELDATNGQRLDHGDEVAETRRIVAEEQARQSAAAESVRALESRLRCDAEVELHELAQELAQVAASKTALKLELSESRNGAICARHDETAAALTAVRAEIASTETQVAEMRPQADELHVVERRLAARLADVVAERKILCAGNRILSAADRQRLESALAENERQRHELLAQREVAITALNQRQTALDAARHGAEEAQTRIASAQAAHSAARELRDQLTDQRREHWRREAKADSQLGTAETDLARLERVVFSSTDRATACGLQTARMLVDRHRITGVYGALYELMTVAEPFRTAVEAVAGGSLFHLVVESDDVATQILDAMKAYRRELVDANARAGSGNRARYGAGIVGHVSLMPLNRMVQPNESAIPADNNVVPMLSKIDFDKRLLPVFNRIFGKAVICPNISMAAKLSREHGLRAVTLQGDRADKYGALSGGFLGGRSKGGLPAGVAGTGSRLDCILAYKVALANRDKLRAEAQDAKTQIARIQSEITNAISTIQKAAEQLKVLGASAGAAPGTPRSIDSGASIAVADWQTKRRHVEAAGRELKLLEARLEKLEAEKRDLETQLGIGGEIETLERALGATSLEATRKGALAKTTPERAAERLGELEREIWELEKQHRKAAADWRAAETRLTSLQESLDGRLVPHELELSRQVLEYAQRLGAAAGKGAAGVLAQSASELKVLERRERELADKIEKAENDAEALRESLVGARAEAERLHLCVQKKLRELEAKENDTARLLQRQRVLRERRDAAETRIRELGVLPNDFTRYVETETAVIMRNLQKVRERLRRYEGQVNKRAFEQYVNFTRDKARLEERRSELRTSAESIRSLIDHFDAQKEDALERTFRQVARNFAQVWQQLVPSGSGSLRMLRADGKVDEPNDSDDGMDLDETDSGNSDSHSDDEDSDEDDRKKTRHGKTRGKRNNAAVSKNKKARSTTPAKRASKTKRSEFVGVGISVSFAANESGSTLKTTVAAPKCEMSQLSGGQKSLVAIALIFAIQKCDPAPFYLFDEIDANLDPQYRATAAKLLHTLSRNAQFITTTHRPEMLAHADNFYGVTFRGKASTLQCIDREEALGFVAQVGEDAQAVPAFSQEAAA